MKLLEAMHLIEGLSVEVVQVGQTEDEPFRDAFGHTPLSIEENIPWNCRRLVVGTGADGALPVMDEVKR